MNKLNLRNARDTVKHYSETEIEHLTLVKRQSEVGKKVLEWLILGNKQGLT